MENARPVDKPVPEKCETGRESEPRSEDQTVGDTLQRLRPRSLHVPNARVKHTDPARRTGSVEKGSLDDILR